MNQTIDQTIAERGARYGEFTTHAEHTQAIKRLMFELMGSAKWKALAADQKEALEMIAHKLGRITNGDPHYDDSWRDIAGYAQLVANRLADEQANALAEAVGKVTGSEPEPEETCGCLACAVRREFKMESVTIVAETQEDGESEKRKALSDALARLLSGE